MLLDSSNTAVAINKRMLLARLRIALVPLVSEGKALLYNSFQCDAECGSIGNTVRELCLMRDGILKSELDLVNSTALLECLCVN